MLGIKLFNYEFMLKAETFNVGSSIFIMSLLRGRNCKTFIAVVVQILMYSQAHESIVV